VKLKRQADLCFRFLENIQASTRLRQNLADSLFVDSRESKISSVVGTGFPPGGAAFAKNSAIGKNPAAGGGLREELAGDIPS
jgi:hypothetical protein